MPQVVRDAYDQYVSALKASDQSTQKALNDADNILGQDTAMVSPTLLRMFSIMDSSNKNTAIEAYKAAKAAIASANAKISPLKQANEDAQNIEQASASETDALNQMVVLFNSLADGLRATLTSSDLPQSQLSGYQSTVNSDLSDVNNKISSLLSQVQAVRQAKDSYESAQLSYQKSLNALDKLKAGATAADSATAQEKVKEAQAQVDKLKAGADPIDLQISLNSVKQRESALAAARNKLQDANDALNDYSVMAPFDGVVGKISTQEAADASAGTALATLITTQQVATISLNEVDVAKIKVGQKASMTFDAVDSLTLTGEVAEVSQVGTVTQGVVNYDVKVAFDSQDDRIKPGMSVSVSIVTQVAADVLTLPNSAVKTQGDQHYVETLNVSSSTQPDASGYYSIKETPQRVAVQVGIANDTLTEITGGLTEGQQVIAQTIKATTGSTAAAASSQSNLLRMASGGGAARITTGGARPPGD